MINIGNTLKRAWHILWNYKLLWVFAFLLAISGGAASGGGGGSGGSGFSGNIRYQTETPPFFMNGRVPQWWNEITDWAEQHVVPWFATEQKALGTMLWIFAGAILLTIVLGLLWALVRYPSETAILRMVDEHESKGTKYRFKEAWKLGWNRRAFRLWLVDLVIGVPAGVIVLLIFGSMALFFFRLTQHAGSQVLPGAFITFPLLVLFIFLFTFVMMVVGLVRNYIVRFAAIDETGVWDSFRKGWQMFKRYLKDNVLMALVLLGIGIAFGIASMIAMFALIPAYAVLAIPGALVAAIPGGIGYGITSLFSTEPLTWIVAGLAAMPFLFTVMFSPMTLLGGMYSVFTMNIWTLMFRQFKAAETPRAVVEEGLGMPPPLEDNIAQ